MHPTRTDKTEAKTH